MTTKAEKINAATGIKVRLLDHATLAASAAAAGLDLKKDETDEQIAVQLHKGYLKAVGGDGDKLAECEDCLGRSPENLKACPYCLEGAGNDKSTPDVAKGGKAALALVPTTGLLPPAEAAKAQQQMVRYTAKDLDAAVANVQQLKVRACQGAWELGRSLGDIADRQLWKLRVDGKDKPRFKTIEAFFYEETGFTPTHAWKLIKVAQKFTALDVERFGTGKLGLVLQAPENVQPALLGAVQSGASKAVIEQEVRRANKELRTYVKKDGTRPRSAGVSRARSPRSRSPTCSASGRSRSTWPRASRPRRATTRAGTKPNAFATSRPARSSWSTGSCRCSPCSRVWTARSSCRSTRTGSTSTRNPGLVGAPRGPNRKEVRGGCRDVAQAADRVARVGAAVRPAVANRMLRCRNDGGGGGGRRAPHNGCAGPFNLRHVAVRPEPLVGPAHNGCAGPFNLRLVGWCLRPACDRHGGKHGRRKEANRSLQVWLDASGRGRGVGASAALAGARVSQRPDQDRA